MRPRRTFRVAIGVLLMLTGAAATALSQPRSSDAVNMVPLSPLPRSATEPPSGDAVPAVASTVPVAEGPAVRAGVAVVDATWHVGASAGQYSGDRVLDSGDLVGQHGQDPSILAVRRVPSYGIQSRTTVRALVVEGLDGTRVALVKDDLYIPQDLLNERAATILADRDREIRLGLIPGEPTGIDAANMMVAVTHNHSSPYYSSPSWGLWAFQDVFDLRFFEWMAQRIAEAVVRASDSLVPVRMGAETVPFDHVQRHSFGPAVGDDGTPAGYPKRENDLTISVLRFDDISDRLRPRPLALFMTLGQHPEMLEGNNLITAEFIGAVERMVDRATGAVTVFAQNDTGSTEPDRECEAHACAVRAEFSHREYAQMERGARQIANAVIGASNDIGTDRPSRPDAYVRYEHDFLVAVLDRQFAPPTSHPYPSVSNCRTHEAFNGNPGVPIVGLPDCDRRLGELFGPVVGQMRNTPLDPGVTYDRLRDAGIPLPENYGAPSYAGLEETFQVHLQVFRLGEVLLTVCPCEQWGDQSRNIKSRADKVQGNIWLGWDWTRFCQPARGKKWTCPDPRRVGDWDGDPARPPKNGTLTITDEQFQRMRAQVLNDARGWDDTADSRNLLAAEAEPRSPAAIKGNYTHTELSPERGYGLVVPVGMANDYWGYIATYREYQRGDHYRKALTGLGAHASDWLATRLVAMGGALKGDPASAAKVAYGPLDETYMVDGAHQEARARALGHDAAVYLAAYEASLPPDGGTPKAITQPRAITRFDVAKFTWIGGSNYTDNPNATVERLVDGAWVTAADMSGEIPVTLDFPDAPELPAYATGSYEWQWTAHFEAFDSDIDTGSGHQTPTGTYRFVVGGLHRHGTPPGAVPYRIVSAPFSVAPWKGITVEDLRLEPDGRVSFRAGPTTTKKFATSYPLSARATVARRAGPIDYPDGWPQPKLPRFAETGSRLFPRLERTLIQDQQYCFPCTFRPWADTGDVFSAVVSVTDASGRVRSLPALRDKDGRWRTLVAIGRGERAQVSSGGVRDAFGEMNGRASHATASR